MRPGPRRARRDVLWPVLLAGGAGVEWYFGYRHAHHDLDCEDFRSRDQLWTQTRIALDFFRAQLVPFGIEAMASCDARLVGGALRHCFGAGDRFVVQWPGGKARGEAVLRLSDPGPWRVDWLDPRHGGALATGGERRAGAAGLSLAPPPTEPRRDWIALVTRASGAP